MKFKVGDRVMASLPVSELWVEYYGALRQPARITSVGRGDYFIKLEKPCAKDDGEWIAADKELTPASPIIPDGWTTADEPPDDARNVEVMLRDGKRGYGFWRFVDCKDWRIFDDDANVNRIKTDSQYYPSSDLRTAAPGEVICWREIQPERLRVGQRVRVKDNARGAEWCTYRAGEVGTIIEYDDQDRDCPYRVEFAVDWWWCYADDLEPLPDETKPEPEDDAPYCVEYVVLDAGARVSSGAHDHKTIMELAEANARNGKVAVYKKVAEITRGPLVVKMF